VGALAVQRWRRQRRPVDEAVMLEHSGQRTTFIQAYPHRGPKLAALSLYDYMSVVKLQRKRGGSSARRALEFEEDWPLSKTWVQVLRKPGEHAVVCLDGYLSMDFSEEDERCHRRYTQRSRSCIQLQIEQPSN
jgi:hypothetical protein